MLTDAAVCLYQWDETIRKAKRNEILASYCNDQCWTGCAGAAFDGAVCFDNAEDQHARRSRASVRPDHGHRR